MNDMIDGEQTPLDGGGVPLTYSSTREEGDNNNNISLIKGCAKDIVSPLGCNSLVGGRVLRVGPSSGANLYYDLSQMMVVRGGLGRRVKYRKATRSSTPTSSATNIDTDKEREMMMIL